MKVARTVRRGVAGNVPANR